MTATSMTMNGARAKAKSNVVRLADYRQTGTASAAANKPGSGKLGAARRSSPEDLRTAEAIETVLRSIHDNQATSLVIDDWVVRVIHDREMALATDEDDDGEVEAVCLNMRILGAPVTIIYNNEQSFGDLEDANLRAYAAKAALNLAEALAKLRKKGVVDLDRAPLDYFTGEIARMDEEMAKVNKFWTPGSPEWRARIVPLSQWRQCMVFQRSVAQRAWTLVTSMIRASMVLNAWEQSGRQQRLVM